jgi:hypothetical protein
MALVEKFKKGDIVVVKGIISPRMVVEEFNSHMQPNNAPIFIECTWFTASFKLVSKMIDQDFLELYVAPVSHPMLD